MPTEDPAQVPTNDICADRVNVWSLLCIPKGFKPALQREVNNEIFFTWLRSYYQINHYYSLLYAVYVQYFVLVTDGGTTKILTYINV